ncbi:MAG: hypothetical protein ISS93_02690 [Candidatus Aenigmarchaeota archaeon]|nr:hypothetical protein [Candidatus Aenigmarchaeota archaeon]
MINGKILVTDGMDIETLQKELGDCFHVDYRPGIRQEELEQACQGVDAIIVKPRVRLDKGLLERAGIKFIGVAGNGTDNIDLAFAKEKGIDVRNMPGESVDSVAEYTLTVLGVMARNIIRAHQSLKGMKWEKDLLIGSQLKGRTLGVLGMGKIGRAVALRADRGLGMQVVGYDPYVKQGDIDGFECRMIEGLGDFLGEADFISVHVPLIEETRNLIGSGEIGKMREGVVIVNVSRAQLFEKEALIAGLRSGKIRGYVTDVHYQEPVGDEDRELIGLENVICTPHIGAQTREAQRSLAEKLAKLVIERLGNQ